MLLNHHVYLDGVWSHSTRARWWSHLFYLKDLIAFVWCKVCKCLESVFKDASLCLSSFWTSLVSCQPHFAHLSCYQNLIALMAKFRPERMSYINACSSITQSCSACSSGTSDWEVSIWGIERHQIAFRFLHCQSLTLFDAASFCRMTRMK